MDIIMINGEIVTMDNTNPRAQALAVMDGRFVKVGSNEEILKLKNDSTEIIDLKGKMVTPGFNDSHLHLLNFGINLKRVDCTGCESVEEVIERGRAFIEKNKISSGEWVLGRGWNQLIFENQEFLTRYDLDRISTEHPICFTRIGEHITAANSKAIELAGITKTTPQPIGGHFDIDNNGEPLGTFRETGRYMIYDMIPDITIEEIKNIILDAAKIASSHGVTSLQTDDFEALPSKDWEKVLRAYKELTDERALPVRIYEQCLLPEIEKLKKFLKLGYVTGYGNEYFKIGPLKLLLDGNLGGRTSLLCEPYSDDSSTCGISIFTQEELNELAVTAHRAGMQLAFHAIGDKAMYMAFEAFEKAQAELLKGDPRFGIIHVQITDETLLRKFKEKNVIAYIQPIFLQCDIHMVEDRVGKERERTSYNFRTLFDQGVHVAISSDCPVEYLIPMKNIYVGVTRKDYNGYPEGGWLPEQKLTIDQMIYGFTMGSAYASFEQDIKGSIEESKLADFVVLSENIYTVAPDDIKDIEIEMTFMDGKLVYQKMD